MKIASWICILMLVYIRSASVPSNKCFTVSLFSFAWKLSFGGIPLPGKPGTFLRKNFHGCMENLYYNGINIIDLAKRRKPQIHSVVSLIDFFLEFWFLTRHAAWLFRISCCIQCAWTVKCIRSSFWRCKGLNLMSGARLLVDFSRWYRYECLDFLKIR